MHSNARRRFFEVEPAVREQVPLLLGLTGPSGSGKTYSALRLATGIARSARGGRGGGIVVIDTENRRARHYADQFAFGHIDFAPPYGSLDYLDALDAAAATRPAVIVVDSLSHEHDGEGGMLDAVTAELDRIAGSDPLQQQRLAAAAWRKPKTARRALLSGLLRLQTHIIVCMRANERSRVSRETPGVEAVDMGFTPVAAPEFIYELACCALLRPGAQGTPTWASALPGEHAAIKLPRQFDRIFSRSQPLCEDHGEALARWASGKTPRSEATAKYRVGRKAGPDGRRRRPGASPVRTVDAVPAPVRAVD
jgi:hypothetical protein